MKTDLNQVILTPQLLSNLYGETLVLTDKNKDKTLTGASVDLQENIQIRSLGMHKKGILVLVNSSNSPFVNDEELAYLNRILNACHLTLEDVALINIATLPGVNYLQLLNQFPSQQVICFGVSPDQLQLPIDFPFYQLQKSGSATYLHALPLQELEPDEEARKKLWSSLKKLFKI